MTRPAAPPQWARYCGRTACAASIERFVRTAMVPGGVEVADILADPNYGGGGLRGEGSGM